jgi:hypothetical protein
MSDISELRGQASAAGYHYLNLYQCCQWKWHLRHNLGLEPLKLSRFLIFGQVFHLVKEAFYKREIVDLDQMQALMRGALTARRELYERQQDFDDDIVRAPVMLQKWHETFGATDFDNYDILAVEEPMTFALPMGFEMSVRPDVVVRERESGRIYCFETKTTSRSASEMAKRVECEHQVDAQTLGVNNWLSNVQGISGECSGVIPDIIYKRQSVCTATRDVIISRTKKELADARLSWAGIFAELASKRLQLEGGVVPEALYSRNGSWCGNFSCEYKAICTSRFEGAPPGYMKSESHDDIGGNE